MNAACVGALALLAFACEAHEPRATQGLDGAHALDAAAPVPDLGASAGGGEDMPANARPDAAPVDETACPPRRTDFPGGPDFEGCASLDGRFHPFQPTSLGSVARTAAFERIGDLLWRNPAPSPADFAEARTLYAVEEGIDSRVQRRYDPHRRADVPAGTNCRTEGVPARYPDFCVGPARILPRLTAAFDAGLSGEAPVVQAARIEAALMWFFWVSVFKEADSCASAIADCDSAHAYYTGESPYGRPVGLAAVVQAAWPLGHLRVFQGTLATHCWRELDSGEVAANTPLMALALQQLDRALDAAALRILADRLDRLAELRVARADTAAAGAFLAIWGEAMDRPLRARDPDVADALAAGLAEPAGPAAPESLASAVSAVATCP